MANSVTAVIGAFSAHLIPREAPALAADGAAFALLVDPMPDVAPIPVLPKDIEPEQATATLAEDAETKQSDLGSDELLAPPPDHPIALIVVPVPVLIPVLSTGATAPSTIAAPAPVSGDAKSKIALPVAEGRTPEPIPFGQQALRWKTAVAELYPSGEVAKLAHSETMSDPLMVISTPLQPAPVWQADTPHAQHLPAVPLLPLSATAEPAQPGAIFAVGSAQAGSLQPLSPAALPTANLAEPAFQSTSAKPDAQLQDPPADTAEMPAKPNGSTAPTQTATLYTQVALVSELAFRAIVATPTPQTVTVSAIARAPSPPDAPAPLIPLAVEKVPAQQVIPDNPDPAVTTPTGDLELPQARALTLPQRNPQNVAPAEVKLDSQVPQSAHSVPAPAPEAPTPALEDDVIVPGIIALRPTEDALQVNAGPASAVLVEPQVQFPVTAPLRQDFPTQQLAGPVTLANLPRMIARVAAQDTAQTTSFLLDPIELGSISFSIDTGPFGLVVTVIAERPETIDLMRRHADQFLTDLRQSGFAGASLQFGQSHNAPSDQGARQPRPEQTFGNPQNQPQPTEPGVHPAPTRKSASGLDLRL